MRLPPITTAYRVRQGKKRLTCRIKNVLGFTHHEMQDMEIVIWLSLTGSLKG